MRSKAMKIGRALLYLVLLSLPIQNSANAQQAAPLKTEGTSVQRLEFAKPVTVKDLDAHPMVAGRFDCGTDGSIFTFINGYGLQSGPTLHDRLALLGIHPDGSVTNFPWRTVPGYIHISMPESIFVGNGNIYVLVEGEKESTTEGQQPRYHLVLTFNQDGSLATAVPLDQDMRPLSIGVFSSGKIILMSEDRLNRRMTATIAAADGTTIREFTLGDSDFVSRAAQMPKTARGTSSYSPFLLISMGKFFPSRDDLILVPFTTSGLPILTLSEQGVVSEVIPQLPDNTVIQSFFSQDSSHWSIGLASVLENDQESLDTQGKVLGVATRPSTRIAELDPSNGKLLRQIDMGGEGIQPACESEGTYRLLTAGAGQGNLQVVTAHRQ